MHKHTKAFLSLPCLFLVGICSCDSRDAETPVAEEFDVIDEEQLGPSEIDSTEPETVEIINDPTEADFNNDGYADLAIGVPGDRASGVRSGSVNVIYGSAAGLRTEGTGTPPDQIWHHNNIFGPGTAEAGDEFGAALTVGHFNGDAFADLAIGAPGDDFTTIDDAGSVTIIYGSANGLAVPVGPNAPRLIFQSNITNNPTPTTPPLDPSETNDNFGSALTAGDFNEDGWDDLAVGVPNEDILAVMNAGAVNVIHGTSAGLSLTHSFNRFLYQGGGLTGETAEAQDRLGAALAAGDFNKDLEDDLAIGVPGEDLTGPVVIDAGLVHVIDGSQGGGLVPDTPNQDIWHQNVGTIEDVAEADDEFGSALTTGDFDNNGAFDLAIGVPFEDVSGRTDAGAVNVIYGSDTFGTGLTDADDQFWHQDQPNVEGSTDSDDLCGAALSAGNYDGDSRDDLAIGCPGENLGEDTDAGAVGVLYGTGAAGLSASGDQRWNQDTDGILDSAEDDDTFGATLWSADFDDDGATDLAIGVPFEDVSEDEDAGAVNVLYGDLGDGLDDLGDQFWHQAQSSVEGIAEDDDLFGAALPDSSAI